MEIQFHNIGNRMISSAIWDKSAQVIFFTSADLSQIAREKSCGYLFRAKLGAKRVCNFVAREASAQHVNRAWS